MTKPVEPKVRTILMAEDDHDYYRMAEDAFREIDGSTRLFWVEDGEACMDYLRRKGPYKNNGNAPLPDLILLDLNMPKKNGFETLREIKKDAVLGTIPVIILTISRAPEDVAQAYSLGAASFITKPLGYLQIVDAIRNVIRYWFQTVALPRKAAAQDAQASS